MKKVFFVLFVGAAVALAACNKEKTCECTTTATGEGIEMDPVVTEVVIEGEDCDYMDAETTEHGITTKVKCVEK